MTDLDHNGPTLARIHRESNEVKFSCHFTGFLEGIAASGQIEVGEVEPLLAECRSFLERISEGDAEDILADFEADLLEHDSVAMMVEVRTERIDHSCEKSALNRFLGYCRGIACDNQITRPEAEGIVRFASAMPSLMAVPGVREIVQTCRDAVADEIISPQESFEICEAISQVVGDSYADTGLSHVYGVANYTEWKLSDFPNSLIGKRAVLTGTFQTIPRRLIEDQLSEIGLEIGKSVSGKTDILIVGGECARDWIEVNRGLKLRKALELRNKGERPLFVSESQLRRLMSLG
ncbi:hypothetical protein FGG78_10235 [Thioclava sp. BHET1]|nr:hypothetical protein FGG78_10235 [Thioclava sp. BHET1]